MTESLAALRLAYSDLAAVAGGWDDAASWQPSACAGWARHDLLFHLLQDAQRALVALAASTPAPPDRDAVTYWRDGQGGPDPESRGLRATRIGASAYPLTLLQTTYDETTRAVLALAGQVPADAWVATQGHVLRADDLLATLVVEAALHHLDLLAADGSVPGPAPLAVVRRTLDALLGRAVPFGWDGASWARAATGRRALTPCEREALGPDADRLPLLA